MLKGNINGEEKWSTWLLRVLWLEEVVLVWVTLPASLKQVQSRTGSKPAVVGVGGPRGRVFLSIWWSWEQQRGQWWEAVHRDGSAWCTQQIIYTAGSEVLKPVKRSTCGCLDFWVCTKLGAWYCSSCMAARGLSLLPHSKPVLGSWVPAPI